MSRMRLQTGLTLGTWTLLLTCLLPGPTRAGESWQVRGWVTGLKPGSSAQIVLSGPRTYQTTTRPGGAWEIGNVAPGVYQVAPTSPGLTFSPLGRRVKVGDADVNAINFKAEGGAAAPTDARPGADQDTRLISGRIVGLKGGDRVTVKLQGPVQREGMTEAGGKFAFSELGPGTYRVLIEDARYRFKPAALNVNVSRADRRHVKIKARPKPGARPQPPEKPAAPETFRVSGKVDGLKAILSGCTGTRVTARGPQTYTVATRTIDSEAACGTFTFPALVKGRYVITVQPPTMTMSRWSFNPSKRKVMVDRDLSGLDFDATSRERRRRR